MITNIGFNLSSSIKDGSYIYDVTLQVAENFKMAEITLGIIVTQTNQTGEISARYCLSEPLLDYFKIKKEELINNLCNKAKEDTKQLNDFFATDF